MEGWREGKISDWRWRGKKGQKKGAGLEWGQRQRGNGCEREITG